MKIVFVIFLLFIQIFIYGDTVMAETSYKLEPKEFEQLKEDMSTEISSSFSISGRSHHLVPKFKNDKDDGMIMDLPNKVIINTDNLELLQWEDVQIPVTFSYLLFYKNSDELYTDHYVLLKNTQSKQEITLSIQLSAHDAMPPPVYNQGREDFYGDRQVFDGGSCTYNILFSGNKLPNYSATYEVWVRIGDVESNRKQLTVELYENGKRIERPKE